MSKWLKISAATIATGLTAAVAVSVAAYHGMTHISDSEKEKGHHKAVAENTVPIMSGISNSQFKNGGRPRRMG